MTSEQRTLIELTDITGIEFECPACKAKILYPLQGEYRKLSEQCPNCGEAWFGARPQRYQDSPTPASEAKQLFASLHKMASSPLVLARVRLHIGGSTEQK
jgi:hypothetical protein